MKNFTISSSYNNTRYIPGQRKGHYESYFLRANHPKKPLAFWIRYTIFNPHHNPERAIGELWFVFFDGESGRHVAAKKEIPISHCSFTNCGFDVHIGNAFLQRGHLKGEITHAHVAVRWELHYRGSEKPIFDFPLAYYEKSFPKAKVLVGLPFAAFNGTITINNKKISVQNWIGSENHNWGSKHTDHYAWGQVAGFDNNSHAFLELATAQIKIGPLWTPFFTPIVLRYEGKEFALNSLLSTFRRASFSYFNWEFHAKNNDIILQGTIRAEKKDFVCLPYYNPPGGVKFCLNSKIASCRMTVTLRKISRTVVLETKHRAAFEILTDKNDHGLEPSI
ncbi:MAG: hypothetical protein N2316_01255 [Spirochaetes bacterium]|nr:hypothetical protein [Spirochaetota bacterium]